MEITWFGHSAFKITEDNLKILIDPFISNNPVCTYPVEEIDADIICITHGHSDHFGDALEIANRTGALILSNHEISLFVSQQGIQSQGMNIGGSYKFHDVKFTMVDAKHSSVIDLSEETIPGGSAAGFIIELKDGTKIYHAGDTGLFSDLKTIIGEIYKPDIAILPIGDLFVMNPEDAAMATSWINPKKVIPMHYNTFPLIEQDTDKFVNLVKSKNQNTEVIILEPGETYFG